jgi:hypothetical protein
MFDILYLRPLMKTVYLICIFLCFLLLGGVKHSYADYNKHAVSQAHLKTAKPAQLQLAVPDKEHAVIKHKASADVSEYLISIDDNDEEDLSMSARKYVILVSFLALSYAFILSSLFSSIKDRLPLCGHLANASSYKYITQRVLRI